MNKIAINELQMHKDLETDFSEYADDAREDARYYSRGLRSAYFCSKRCNNILTSAKNNEYAKPKGIDACARLTTTLEEYTHEIAGYPKLYS